MTTYDSKAAQKQDLDRLNRQYEKLLTKISRCYQPRAFYDLDLPYSLANYRPAKHDSRVGKDAALQIKGLIVAREAVKTTPIVKPPSKQQQREASISLKFGDNPSLKAAMLEYAPTLAKHFADGWREQIARRFARGDHKLEYIGYYGQNKDVPAQVREQNNKRHSFWLNVRSNLQFVSQDGVINENKLEAAAKEYGHKTALGWYWKMATKLGKGVGVKAVVNPQYVNINVYGTIDGHDVSITQDIVYKVSSKGTPFHQFPARIYVDSRFMTEAEFAKRFH